MFNIDSLREEYNAIFDSNGKIKVSDNERVVNFCKAITMLTGIQVCNKYGNVYEYIHEVYKSAIGILIKEAQED